MKTEKQRLLAELMGYWVDELIEKAAAYGRGQGFGDVGKGAKKERDIRVLRQKILGYTSELMEDSPTVVKVELGDWEKDKPQ